MLADMLSRLAVVAAILLVASTASADPAAWSSSFDPKAVASHHATPTDSVMVVGAGDVSPARDEAAAALLNAYQGSGAKVALDAKALGDVSTLSDPEIVQRAANQPVVRIAVVRIYGASPATAVVAVYDKTGAPVTSFVTTEGTALPGRSTEAHATAVGGVSKETIDAVDDAKKKSVEATQEKEKKGSEAFDREFLWPESGGRVRGRQLQPVDDLEFYKLVGRQDLIEKYEGRGAVKTGLMIGGGIASIVGVVIMWKGLDTDCADSTDEYEVCEPSFSGFLTGMGVTAAGVAVFTIGASLPRDTVPAYVRRDLALAYNAKLRKEAGLPDDYTPSRLSHRRERGEPVRLSPYVGPAGGGLVLQGRF